MMIARAIRELWLAVLIGVALPAVTPVRAQLPEVESEILVRLDVSSLDVYFLNEPYRTAFENATTAEVRLRFHAFGWDKEHISNDGSFADYWSYRSGSMSYELRVGSLRRFGTNSTKFTPAALWSHVIFGSFPSAPGATAFRVSVGDSELQVQIRSEELPGAPAIYGRFWLPRQRFPAYAEDFLPGFVDRLVVEIRGTGTNMFFTGSAFAHADPVRNVIVTPARPVATEAASWTRLKTLYQH
jgi:hypothetical protein